MAVPAPLTPEKLYRVCDPDVFGFETTSDAKTSPAALGQGRAVDAIRFGLEIPDRGYHLFAAGPVGVGKYATVRRFAADLAREASPPDDWCYVYNFDDPYKPTSLRLPAGRAHGLKADVEGFVEDLRTALEAAFESEEFRLRRQVISEEFEERERQALQKLEREAREVSLGMHRTPTGLIFVPLGADGDTIEPDAWKALSEADRTRIEGDIQKLQKASQEVFQQMPSWQREFRTRLRALTREVTQFTVGHLMEDLRGRYADVESVAAYLGRIEQDVVEHAREIVGADEGPGGAQAAGARGRDDFTRRYRVNVLTARGEGSGAPVVYEENPTFANLIGRVEHVAEQGALIADFNLIKPGALHLASGGYLILDAHKLLTQPGAYEGLKRSLKYRRVRIESLGQAFSAISTVSLDPEPIPIDLKVVLIGDRQIYYLLQARDPEFDDLFKVFADFEDDMEWTARNARAYGVVLAQMARSSGLMAFEKSAVGRLTEHGARLAGNARKLTTRYQSLQDVMREANHAARQAGADVVTEAHVETALGARRERSSRIPDRVREVMVRKTIMIDTSGRKVGQINGLSVSQLGDTAFGRPTRITAQVRMGRGEVVDIEREVALSGPIHSKGVLILSGFLAGRFATEHPLSLSASLVFEQSYGGIDGDSASSAELYALLSAIAEVPIDQSFAVTGSVNQYGEVQAIGGANEKIEGFFDLCRARRLTGRQGVLIPAANVDDLMLKDEVVDAVRDETFRVIPVSTIDEGIEILTGVPAGRPNRGGDYPADSVNGRVQDRLERLAEKRSAFGRADREDRT